ncbi:hydrolase, carbon-nitrogen family [Chytriomyces cf. hyalinus JEL632]|nr:hydrolase, carbon-nitrogen family [Chytriomyces cf. hyalinus JEL632]
MKVAVVQIAPVLLDKKATFEKVEARIAEAAAAGASLVTFGEATVPGYPWWVERTDGARWDAPQSKKLYAKYATEAVNIDRDLVGVQALASSLKITVVLGIIERSGHSLYCTALTISNAGVLENVHRKLMPTFEERLVWAQGDGHGLKVSSVGEFSMGVLNCWENWMPLARTSLYAQGENLHVSIWPGCLRNTQDLMRFIALESRSFVVGACNLMSKDILKSAPDFDGKEVMLAEMEKRGEDWIADGGSCVCGPDGNWIIPPFVKREGIEYADIEMDRVLEERQNFDVTGHYSRPDVLSLKVNRQRLSAVTYE